MRPWICMLVLGAGLTAAGTLPAAANNMTSRSPNVAANGHARTPFLRHGFFRHHPLLGPFAFGGPVVFPGGFFDGDVIPGFTSGTPPLLLLSGPPAAPELPRRSAVEERASVETTPDGVVVVRGPGSRHLGH
jgi:hypothetical protein